MRKEIHKELQLIEQDKGVRILYACEAGSRAWGFESPDSDYDVRFIYARPLDWYLSITEGRDVIERPISNLLDISGWDIKKALQLFRKSNPPLFEWLDSPIVYCETGFEDELRMLIEEYYSPRACAFHYFHMARGNFQKYLQGDIVSLKKYFYVIRPLLAIKWMQRFDSQPPATKFVELLWASELPVAVLAAIYGLLERKTISSESMVGPKIQSLHEWIEAELDAFDQSRFSATKNEKDSLDKLFRDTVR